MQTHPAVGVGFELATDGIQFHVFAELLRRCRKSELKLLRPCQASESLRRCHESSMQVAAVKHPSRCCQASKSLRRCQASEALRRFHLVKHPSRCCQASESLLSYQASESSLSSIHITTPLSSIRVAAVKHPSRSTQISGRCQLSNKLKLGLCRTVPASIAGPAGPQGECNTLVGSLTQKYQDRDSDGGGWCPSRPGDGVHGYRAPGLVHGSTIADLFDPAAAPASGCDRFGSHCRPTLSYMRDAPPLSSIRVAAVKQPLSSIRVATLPSSV